MKGAFQYPPHSAAAQISEVLEMSWEIFLSFYLHKTTNMLLNLSQNQQLCPCSLCAQDSVGGEEL